MPSIVNISPRRCSTYFRSCMLTIPFDITSMTLWSVKLCEMELKITLSYKELIIKANKEI